MTEPEERGILGKKMVKKPLTIQHVDHYARGVCVARDAGVISAVARSRLCHQKLARCPTLGFLSFQGDSAPVMNAAYYQTYYRTDLHKAFTKFHAY